MNFIVTADQDEFHLDSLDQAKVKPYGIAWSLSQINRFNGHALRPYSVAEHSLLVCEIVEREMGLDVFGQLAALLHDAHEAYCGDITSPAKAVLGPAWAQFEDSTQRLVRTAFRLHTAFAANASFIKLADRMALATEKRDLIPRTPNAWPILRDVEPVPWVRLHDRTRTEMGWEDWRDRWLDKYHELDFARNEKLFNHTQQHDAPGPSDNPQG